MAGGSRKGSPFERAIAKELSLWWTGGARDDVLYRSDSSGARATARRKKGQSTANAQGDLCAKDPCAFPLLRFLTWELKRGYSSRTVQDLLDEPGRAVQTYEEWFSHAEECARHAGSVGWAVVVRRDQRKALIFLPERCLRPLSPAGDWNALPRPKVLLYRELADNVVGLPLAAFLRHVTPDQVRKAVRDNEQSA